MGIGDFGITPSSSDYSYTTNRFLGSIELRSLSTYGPQFDLYSVTLQLNVVLYLTFRFSNRLVLDPRRSLPEHKHPADLLH